jgi:hypothetical protein
MRSLLCRDCLASKASDMNWKSGLFRVWLVVSVGWIALCAVAIQSRVAPRILTSCVESACFSARTANHVLGNPFDCFDDRQNAANPYLDMLPDRGQRPLQSCRNFDDVLFGLRIHWQELAELIIFAISLPLGLLVFWWIGVWITAGFRRTTG